MTTSNESQQPKRDPQLPQKKGGGDGDAKGTDSGIRRGPQANQKAPSQATPPPRTKSRKITSSRV